MNQLFGHPTDHRVDSDSTPPPARPLPVGGAEQAFFHLDVKRSLQLHGKLAKTIAVLGVLAAIGYFALEAFVLKRWPVYEADSLVYVQPTAPKVLEPSQGGSSRWPFDTNTYETYIGQQMMNVTRDDVLASALKKIGDFQEKGESEQKAAQRLAQSLVVSREGAAYQFSIGARAGEAQYAADIANDVTKAYLESISRDQRSGNAERIAMLTDERDRITKALDADRAEQQDLNRAVGVASVGSSVPDHFDEDITGTRQELIKARIEHDAAAAKIAALNANTANSAEVNAVADEMIANDAGLVSMKTTLNQRRATLISQMANLTPSHPLYKQDEVELAKIDGELDGMMKDLRAKAAARVQLNLQADLQRTAGVESQVNGQLRSLVGAAGSATPKMQRLSDLSSDITRLQARFATVDEQLHNLMLEDNAPASAYQVTPAVAPLNRAKSGVLRNMVLLVFAGIFCGVCAAILRHKLDPKVYIAKDVELVIGFSPMAMLPDFDEVPSGVGEEYLLRLATSLEHARKQSHIRSAVFTGTSAGNGVTTLVNRVGEMLEAMGRPTLMVDASGAPAPDRHPRIAAAESTPGLVPVDRVARPTALLHQMTEETEAQEESLVLTDTAPLPVSAETEYLARFVDCAIVIVQSGKTTRRELRQAAATLQRLDVAAVGFVLNRVGLEKADPAFRDSVKAIEAHLEAQAASHAAYREEMARKFAAQRAWKHEELAAGDETETSNESPVRAHFEAEAAAAGAAVERLAHPAAAEIEGVLPKPEDQIEQEKSSAQLEPINVVAHEHEATTDEAHIHEVLADYAAAEHPVEIEQAATLHSDKVIAHETSAIEDHAIDHVAEVVPQIEAEEQEHVMHEPAFSPLAEAASRVSSSYAQERSRFPRFISDDAGFAVKAEHLQAKPHEVHTWASEPAEIVEAESASDLHWHADEFERANVGESSFVLGESVHDDHESEPKVYDLDSAMTAAHATEEVSERSEPNVEQIHEAKTQQHAAMSDQPLHVDAPATDVSEAVVEALTASHGHATEAPTEPALQAPTQPSWFSDAQTRRVSHRPPVIWRQARVGMESHSVSESANAANAPAAASVEPAEVETTDPQTPIDAGFDHTASNLPSRLSGLRNLLFVLGVKGGQEHAEAVDQSDREDFAHEEHQAFHDEDAPHIVSAHAEILPPKTVVINAARDGVSDANSRQDRRAPYDSVDILPSRRGQYKKI